MVDYKQFKKVISQNEHKSENRNDLSLIKKRPIYSLSLQDVFGILV